MKYDHSQITKTVQKKWQNNNIFQAKTKPSKKCYVLSMFPYPSGNIHMGHVRNYVIGDVIARYKRSCGYDVLQPIGWDAFGLPAENAAITNKINPQIWTMQNIQEMSQQLKKIGFSYDWGREFATCDPKYFAQEQKFFLQMLKNGLVYQKEELVNWDPVDKTVLANEQVVDGKGWRSGAVVEKKKLKQWFVRASKYADKLLLGLDKLNEWPEKVKHMQEKWIGKSTGAIIKFEIENSNNNILIFSTKPETLSGASFCALSLSHPVVSEIAQKNTELNQFIKDHIKDLSAHQNIEKHGYLLDIHVINPINKERLPVYAANFVLSDYGTGAIFGCPAHDERDFEFATKYHLPINPVIECDSLPCVAEEGVIKKGIMFEGKTIKDARKAMISYLTQNNLGNSKEQYRLKDWGISRQRYWGCPIPIIYCEHCGVVPVPIEDLPLELPKDIDLSKIGNHLDMHSSWKHTTCPKCKKEAIRETDTFDTFFESSWYYLAFCSPDYQLSEENCRQWMPVDHYIGGIEHAILHLLYSRLFCFMLHDIGYTFITHEPFTRLLTQGMVCHQTFQDKDGKWLTPIEAANKKDVIIGPMEKMSKSKKNVIEPSEMLDKYGADTIRMFVISDTPPEKDLEWSDSGVSGVWRFINKVWDFIVKQETNVCANKNISEIMQDLSQYKKESIYKALNVAIKDVSEHIEQNHFNCAIADIRIFFNALVKIEDPVLGGKLSAIFVKLIDPFVPHTAQVLWEYLGGNDLLCNQQWPNFDEEAVIEKFVNMAVQINGKFRGTITVAKDTKQEEAYNAVKSDQKISTLMPKEQYSKIIFVPNKIINIVF